MRLHGAHDFPKSPHARSVAEVLAALDVTVAAGLSEEEAKRRLDLYGLNAIVSRRRVSALAVLIHQFGSPVIALLAVAAGVAFYFGELEEGSAIAGVLALNALIGYVAEIRRRERTCTGRKNPGRHDTRRLPSSECHRLARSCAHAGDGSWPIPRCAGRR